MDLARMRCAEGAGSIRDLDRVKDGAGWFDARVSEREIATFDHWPRTTSGIGNCGIESLREFKVVVPAVLIEVIVERADAGMAHEPGLGGIFGEDGEFAEA